jgi:serine phosphatase RsbU (regulator of sigma subunit)/predicted enzyme related to lactoylglutathione lyase
MPPRDRSDETSDPYLRIQSVTVSVTRLDRSLEFYEATLGFRTLRRIEAPMGGRIAFVTPPDGSTLLILSETEAPHPGSLRSGITFVTDDIARQHREWLSRGVAFQDAPRIIGSGARLATFSDPDGNAFALVEADEITKQIEAERQSVADQAEGRRRAIYELGIATQVQAGLFPRQRPSMKTLQYAGMCVQARQVGGDYFDFLDFGGGRLGVVIGDVSGKGLGAALLMANLQACIRSHYALYPTDLSSLLRSVNRLFQESAPAASYASLFFGVFEDQTGRLTYINCGHPPALLMRADGRAEWLEATSAVLGMFEEWSGTAQTIDLATGDAFVLYTDGVTEAFDPAGNEFGQAEMAAVCRDARGDADAMLDAVVSTVRAFSGDQQGDDMTVVTACVRTGEGIHQSESRVPRP